MEAVVIGIIALALSFGGGTFLGYSKAKKHSDKIILQIHEDQQVNNARMTAKLDSLQSLPAKVDTVIVNTELIIERTDTLILTNKKILDNTEVIKADVREIKNTLLKE